ncbi:MAG: hypothetical protein IPL79_08765 [Myxococcales bacterium]|nr:hypothetical protein [Myxococcales bacterium]
MSKPIWELEPDELNQELARPGQRTPRVSDAARLTAGLATLATSDSGVQADASSEFDDAGDTQDSPNAWKEQLEESVAEGDQTIVASPSTAALAGAGAAFSPPTAQISRAELEALRSELTRNTKK